jgi:hypothetical protein
VEASYQTSGLTPGSGPILASADFLAEGRGVRHLPAFAFQSPGENNAWVISDIATRSREGRFPLESMIEWSRLSCWTPRAVIIYDPHTAERSADLWLVRVVPPACRS